MMIMICLFFIGWSGKEGRRTRGRVKKKIFVSGKHKNNFSNFSLPPVEKILCVFLACFHASSTEKK
jgi:hypothetical protein